MNEEEQIVNMLAYLIPKQWCFAIRENDITEEFAFKWLKKVDKLWGMERLEKTKELLKEEPEEMI